MADKAVASASLLLFCDNKKFMKGVNESRKKWEGFTKNLDDLNKKHFNNNKFGQSMVSGLKKITPAISVVTTAFSALMGVVQQVLKALLAIGAVSLAGLAAGINKAVGEASKFEERELNLKLTAGSAVAKELSDWFRGWYPGTSVSPDEGYQAMADFTRFDKTPEEIKQLMQVGADLGTLTGKGANGGISALVEIEKALSLSGKLNTRVAKQIQSGLGIDVMSALGQMYGLDEYTTRQKLDKGLFSASAAEGIILSEGSRYQGATQARSNTFAGSIETVKAQFNNLMTSFGEVILPILTEILGRIQDFLIYVDSHKNEIMLSMEQTRQLLNIALYKIIELIDNIWRWLYSAKTVLNTTYKGSGVSSQIETFNAASKGDWKGTALGVLEQVRNLNPAHLINKGVTTFISDIWKGREIQQEGGFTQHTINDLNKRLAGTSFSPSAISAGMAENAIKRANDKEALNQRLGIYGEGYKQLSTNAMKADSLDELNDNTRRTAEGIDYLVNQTRAQSNSAIPVN